MGLTKEAFPMAEAFKKMERDILEHVEEHDVDVVASKQKDIAKHEEELKDDKSKFMKDLREKEIQHDENVIERKQEHIGKDERKITEENREIEAAEAKEKK